MKSKISCYAGIKSTHGVEALLARVTEKRSITNHSESMHTTRLKGSKTVVAFTLDLDGSLTGA